MLGFVGWGSGWELAVLGWGRWKWVTDSPPEPWAMKGQPLEGEVGPGGWGSFDAESPVGSRHPAVGGRGQGWCWGAGSGLWAEGDVAWGRPPRSETETCCFRGLMIVGPPVAGLGPLTGPLGPA